MESKKINLDPTDVFWLMKRTLDYSNINAEGIGDETPEVYCIIYDASAGEYVVSYNGVEIINYGRYESPLDAFKTFVDLQANNYPYAEMTREKLLQKMREQQDFYQRQKEAENNTCNETK